MLRSFRLVCDFKHIPLVEALLRAENYDFAPEKFSPYCRILTHEPKPLGSSLAAFFGLIYIQDRSSMLPPLALLANTPAVHQNSAVLDMCASPGSKTGFLAQLLGKNGFVLGNEPSKSRLATLRANMQSLNLLQVATCSYAGEKLPLLPNTWDFIQLDPPCSGWGTVEKNPNVLKLWSADKVKPLITLQKTLLRKAFELLRPGGQVVYSTCTTNVDENEEQVYFAMQELGFELLPLEPFEGFVWQEPFTTQSGAILPENTLRVDGKRSNAQGFYIAKLRKPHSSATHSALTDASEEQIDAPRLFSCQQELSPHLLSEACTEKELLPNGIIGLFGETARFIPQAAQDILPATLTWQASALGKIMGKAQSTKNTIPLENSIRLSPRCRALMPTEKEKVQDHAIILEKIEDIHSLLQGQSRQTQLEGRETGLYFAHQAHTDQLLPLGRVHLKKGRALWPIR